VLPSQTLPGSSAYTSQIWGPLPSSFQAPSTWYEDVAAPQTKPGGNLTTWCLSLCKAQTLSGLARPRSYGALPEQGGFMRPESTRARPVSAGSALAPT